MKKLVILFVLSMAALTACQRKVDFGPRPINYDRDVCYVCKMGLDDPKYNVEAINERGEMRTYDDIGCLAEDMREGDFNTWKGKKYKIWVGDAETGKWIDAEKAYYRFGDRTPMGYGYGALARKPADSVTVYDFKTVIERINKGLSKRAEFIKQHKMSVSGGESADSTGGKMKCGAGKCGAGKCGGGK